MESKIIESYTWVKKCIELSTNRFHFDCCFILLESFENKFRDDPECKRLASALLQVFVNCKDAMEVVT